MFSGQSAAGEQMLTVDLEHPLMEFTFDGERGWFRSPTPHRLLFTLAQHLRPNDLHPGMRLAVRLGWQVLDGKRWRHAQVLRVLTSYAGNKPGAPDAAATDTGPLPFSSLLASSPRSDRPGGARGDVGRKALAVDEATEGHCVTLPASAWRLLERVGGGNRSNGVRRLVEAHQAQAEKDPT